MSPRAAHATAILVNLASGAALVLLASLVSDLGPLPAFGWWAIGSGAILAAMAFPSGREVRDSLLPGALAALMFGLVGFALELSGSALMGLYVVLALAVAPAASRFVRMGMPSPRQLGALSGGILGVVLLVSLGNPEPGILLVVIAGLTLTGHTLAVDHVLHRHRVIALDATVLLVAGGLLLISGFSGSGFSPPRRDQLPILLVAIAVSGVALPLTRVRLAQHLTAAQARHHLPWFLVGTVLASSWATPLSTLEFAAAATLLGSAWLAGGGPSTVTEAEALRIGP